MKRNDLTIPKPSRKIIVKVSNPRAGNKANSSYEIGQSMEQIENNFIKHDKRRNI
jgi:hypothetical protein